MALSYYDHATPIDLWWDKTKHDRAIKRAATLAHKHGGHNKFLESIQLWVYVQAPRSFWSEFDTYRVGITKQSSSTMHTLSKRITTVDDYDDRIYPDTLNAFNKVLADNPDVTTLKANLPEAWLQERVISTNYKCLQNIIAQRHDHRLKHWQDFCTQILATCAHPEFLWQGLNQANTKSTSLTSSENA
jgi:hypothetical protein